MRLIKKQIFFSILVISNLFGQTPILKSTTVGVTTLGATSSIITENNGRLGIGTVSPTSFLHLRQVGTLSTLGSPGISSARINLEYISPIGGASTQYLISTNTNNFTIGKVGGYTDQFRLLGNTTFMKGEIRNIGVGVAASNYISLLTQTSNKSISWCNSLATEATTPLSFKYDPIGTINDKIVLSLHPNGQVRIGDANTSYDNFILGSSNVNNQIRLSVEGGVVAQRYITTLTNWADFVFHPDTINPTLQDEKRSIETNYTLLDVPSEKDILNGRDLAETDVILLMKLEQLYLHVIKQQELIEQLQSEIVKLKNGQQ